MLHQIIFWRLFILLIWLTLLLTCSVICTCHRIARIPIWNHLLLLTVFTQLGTSVLTYIVFFCHQLPWDHMPRAELPNEHDHNRAGIHQLLFCQILHNKYSTFLWPKWWDCPFTKISHSHCQIWNLSGKKITETSICFCHMSQPFHLYLI